MLLAKQDTEDVRVKRGEIVRIMIDMSKGENSECEGGLLMDDETDRMEANVG